MASNRGIKATEMILKTLERADNPPEEVKPEQENFDDITLFDMTKDESSISLQQAPNMSNSNFDDLDDDFDKLQDKTHWVFNRLDGKKNLAIIYLHIFGIILPFCLISG